MEMSTVLICQRLNMGARDRRCDEPQLRGLCTVHRSENPRSRSFSVHVAKRVYRCVAACYGSEGSQLDLYAAATNQPLYEGALDVCHRLRILSLGMRRPP